ncbi:MAG: GNAT family N-acetyltransferase [Alphaproteobacteria bacterium]|nr:GNAT family N-acetyltransferase [Alphaproteobacteria bacterium]
MKVRLADISEISTLKEVEDDASVLFRSLPELAFVLDYPPREISEYEEFVRSGNAFVSEGAVGISGIILLGVVDGRGHIWELSVRMAFQRQGAGRHLIEAGCRWAKSRGCDEVTLTTFKDAPWNAPTYARLGFEIFQPDGMRAELGSIIEHERSIGLLRAPRVAMRKPVSAT